MAQTSTKPTDFNRALDDAKKNASGVAEAMTGAAQDVYGQARDSAADVMVIGLIGERGREVGDFVRGALGA